jgi:hypothetical protein
MSDSSVSYASAAAKVEAPGEEENKDWASYGLYAAVKPWHSMCDWFALVLSIKLVSVGSMPVCNNRALLNAEYISRNTGKPGMCFCI